MKPVSDLHDNMADTELLHLLETDIETCRQLLETLDLEFTALGERQLDQLQTLLQSKQPLLESIARNANRRTAILREHGHEASGEGFAAFVSNSPLAATLLEQHQQLASLMDTCQAANIRNGRLIRTQQVGVGSALNILRGNDGPALYNRSGSTISRGTHRTFTRA